MIFQSSHSELLENREAIINSDICIVGAGPAGITLANQLSKNNSIKITVVDGDINFNLKNQKLNRAALVQIILIKIILLSLE